ncbi:SDR family NAD(P)-dependent oxidoreductase [Vibrio agarivorans]|uniref:SDR family NAD(P)-dependent oxidoreductase n=1 Tax=Vibrio agarivorans TaxID=153622 RepID=A0ABT7XYD5_9VIBR|nr:SDR family NAD(P)-dependent oxidoreductase [Vibrio agarivorans]MDN2480791.1 SDR family NAD(P)-dependent oxidoreductase [Vibrio agarivorans]
MKKIVIWGAGSGLGLAMAEYYQSQGFTVYGVSRNPDKSDRMLKACHETFACDATQQDLVNETVNKLPQDAWVISTMGSFRAEIPVDYIGHRYLIDALERHNQSRFLLVTSLGCGDSWQYLSDAAKKGFGGAVKEKTLAEAWLQSSSLPYTILRPGGLVDGPETQSGELSQGIEVHGIIHRSEVARLSYQLLSSRDSLNKIYQCIDPNANKGSR